MKRTPDSPDDLAVLILAGGASRRMGRDKLWLEIDGRPLIERVINRLLPLATEFIVSSNAPDVFDRLAHHLPVPLRAVPDQFKDAGPLAGLHAGLSAMQAGWAFAVAADMPFVNPKVVNAMRAVSSGYDSVMPRITSLADGTTGLEPLHALYHTGCVRPIEERLIAGERRLISFLPDVRVIYAGDDLLGPVDPHHLSFLNINTPEEYQQALALLTDQ